MKVTLESTTKIVELRIDGVPVPARVWQGATDSGIPIHVFITRVAVAKSENHAQFERELLTCADPRADVAGIPLRLIL